MTQKNTNMTQENTPHGRRHRMTASTGMAFSMAGIAISSAVAPIQASAATIIKCTPVTIEALQSPVTSIEKTNTDGAKDDTSAMANEMAAILNAYRTAHGLSDVTLDSALSNDASIRAQEISVTFGHTRPDGSEWYSLDPSRMYGENLAAGYSAPAQLMAAFQNSPVHNQNLLDGRYHSIGIGIYGKRRTPVLGAGIRALTEFPFPSAVERTHSPS